MDLLCLQPPVLLQEGGWGNKYSDLTVLPSSSLLKVFPIDLVQRAREKTGVVHSRQLFRHRAGWRVDLDGATEYPWTL